MVRGIGWVELMGYFGFWQLLREWVSRSLAASGLSSPETSLAEGFCSHGVVSVLHMG